MPKSLDVVPSRFAQRGTLSFPDLPVYRYERSVADENQARGEHTLIGVLRHMLILREFETMLGDLRAKGEYARVKCRYQGPAHLSAGQEAAAVGAALALSPDDHVFGNHRSHGEFLAKGLSAITQLGDNALANIMSSHAQGTVLASVSEHIGGEGKALAENFLLFGLLSEILMRASGFNGGMGGSMHAFFPPFGSYPNNAIVGASAGIATGAALHRKLHGHGITMATAGDGATGCGPVWEAMNFAAMAQFDTLWDDALGGGLPVLFFFNNNFYAMGGQTIGETMGWDRLARIAGGINSEALHAETVDGTRPLAVAEAVAAQRVRLLAGQGPALLDVECYRYSGHSTSDANVYRSREEMKAWQGHDCITRYADELMADGVLSQNDVTDLRSEVANLMAKVTEAAANPDIAPIVDIHACPTLIGDLMFHDEPEPSALHGQSDCTTSVETGAMASAATADAKVQTEAQAQALSYAAPEPFDDADAMKLCSRLLQNAKKSRFGLDESGVPISPMRAITLRDGLFEAVLHHLRNDQELILYGEECREWGGAFGVYRGLADLYPHHRVFNSPISEAAIVAAAVGYALAGGKALVELMYADFIGRAGDEILNQMAKWHAMSAGALRVPVVLRCSVGSKYGAQHSQDWSSLIAHVPGLKVVYPATPHDAKGLLSTALAGNDPVVFFESQRLYDVTERFENGGVPRHDYQLPLGEPALRRKGDALTLLTIGPALYPALEAADTLAADHGLSAEVFDARSLVPFNYAPLLASVRKTGRIAIISEASERGSFAMTLATTITRHAFADLKAPPRVIGVPNWIVPGADMESTYFAQPADIIDAVFETLFPEQSYQPQGIRRWDELELARRGL